MMHRRQQPRYLVGAQLYHWDVDAHGLDMDWPAINWVAEARAGQIAGILAVVAVDCAPHRAERGLLQSLRVVHHRSYLRGPNRWHVPGHLQMQNTVLRRGRGPVRLVVPWLFPLVAAQSLPSAYSQSEQ